MKHRILCAAALLMTLGWMAVIFSFSAQSGEASGGLSAIIAEPVTKLLSRWHGPLSAQEEAALYQQVDGAIRTAAHFSEYAVLGGLLFLLFKAVGIRWLWLPWAAGTLYAVTDEWHQSFSPGRVCDPVDVLIDASGVLAGILLFNMIIKIWRKKHVHDS